MPLRLPVAEKGPSHSVAGRGDGCGQVFRTLNHTRTNNLAHAELTVSDTLVWLGHLIPVDILKSVSDGYSIIRLAASLPTSNYGKGRIFDPEPVSIFGLSSRMYAVGSRRRVGLLAHPDPRRSPDPSLFGCQ